MTSVNFEDIAKGMRIDISGLDPEDVEERVYQRIDLVKARIEASEKVRKASDAKADEYSPIVKSQYRLDREEEFNKFRSEMMDRFEQMALEFGTEQLEKLIQCIGKATSSTTEEEFAAAVRNIP